MKLHLVLLLRQNQSVNRTSGDFFVEALRWILLFEHDGVRVFNDMSMRQASAMIEGLKGGGVN